MKKFKVLHVSSALSWRGGEQQIVNLIDGLTLINENIVQMIFCARESAIEKYSISYQINFESAKKKSAIDLFYLSASACMGFPFRGQRLAGLIYGAPLAGQSSNC